MCFALGLPDPLFFGRLIRIVPRVRKNQSASIGVPAPNNRRSLFVRMGADVPPDRPECPAGADDFVVEPGLPFEFGHAVSSDLFGAHRFVLPDDGPQRMGVQPEFVRGFRVPRRRRFVPPGRIYGMLFGHITIGICRRFRRDADQSMHVIGHHHPRIQPHVRPHRGRPLPFPRGHAPRPRQPNDAVPHPSEKRAPIRRANRDEIPCRRPVIPLVMSNRTGPIPLVSCHDEIGMMPEPTHLIRHIAPGNHNLGGGRTSPKRINRKPTPSSASTTPDRL